jgi:hypothetical protein
MMLQLCTMLHDVLEPALSSLTSHVRPIPSLPTLNNAYAILYPEMLVVIVEYPEIQATLSDILLLCPRKFHDQLHLQAPALNH